MSADLKVIAVSPPPGPLRAPCPVVVVVRIRNDGNDTASPVDFDVTIDLGVTDMPGATFETIVTDPEDMAFSPGREIDVPVLVEFPCTSPVMLRATVDLKHRIPNNDRTAPSMTLTGLVMTPMPWLTVTLRLGIRDAAGVVTFDPDVFCPGKVVVADIVIENKGCVPSKASKTDVTLEDANTVPSPVALTSRKYLVPALPPSGSHHTSLSFPTPTSSATTSGALAVRVSADTSVANPDQCDRTHLDVRIVKPFSAGGPPQLTLTGQGGGSIRPGEVPTVSWSVRNECSEIGTADVKLLFGMPPTELYRTQQMIPLGSTVGEDVALTIPPTIASAFWTFWRQGSGAGDQRQRAGGWSVFRDWAADRDSRSDRCDVVDLGPRSGRQLEEFLCRGGLVHESRFRRPDVHCPVGARTSDRRHRDNPGRDGKSLYISDRTVHPAG